MLRDTKTAEPKRSDNLHHAGQDLRERSWYPQVREQSLTSAAQMRRWRPPASPGEPSLWLSGPSSSAVGCAAHRRRPKTKLRKPFVFYETRIRALREALAIGATVSGA